MNGGPAMSETANKRIQSASPMHIVLVADDSGSMKGQPAADVTLGLQTWVLELQQATRGKKPYFRFSLIVFGSHAEIVAEAVSINDVDATSLELDGAGGTTDLAAALRLVDEVLLRDSAGEADCPPFVFLYTDGKPNDARAALEAAEQLKALRLPCGSPELIALGFGDADEALLRRMVSQPGFYKTCRDSAGLARLLPAVGTPTSVRGGPATVESFRRQIAEAETDI
jgi:uncharacterized protein YegL